MKKNPDVSGRGATDDSTTGGGGIGCLPAEYAGCYFAIVWRPESEGIGESEVAMPGAAL